MHSPKVLIVLIVLIVIVLIGIIVLIVVVVVIIVVIVIVIVIVGEKGGRQIDLDANICSLARKKKAASSSSMSVRSDVDACCAMLYCVVLYAMLCCAVRTVWVFSPPLRPINNRLCMIRSDMVRKVNHYHLPLSTLSTATGGG